MSKKDRAANRTERAAAIQAQQASKERNRRLLIGGIVVVVLAAIVAAGVIFSGGKSTPSTGGSGPKAVASGQALVVGDDPEAATTVVIYEDFLCPYCREFEAATRDSLHAAAKKGTVLVEYRPFHLLPDEYSTLSLTAWAAVLQKGTGSQALKLHDLLYDNQPDENAADKPGIEDLVDLAKKAGVEDQAVLDAMKEKDQEFVDAAGRAATDADVKGTPTAFVNGKELQGASVTEMAANLEKILAAG